MSFPAESGRLSARLRAGTRADRDAAGRSAYLDALAAGRLPWEAYADLAAQHFFIYESLEQATAAMADDPVAGPFAMPQLTRLPSIVADLRYLHGPAWERRIAALPATTTYCTRLRDVAFDRSWAYIAHHWTRYAGDLTDGQRLGAAVAVAYSLDGGGHRFFVFDHVDPAVQLDRYGALLDGLLWSRADEDRFLVEVSRAYRLNVAVLRELGRRWT
jgi:heme oxygenase